MGTARAALEAGLSAIESAEDRLVQARARQYLQPIDFRMTIEGLLLRTHVTFETFVQAQFFEHLRNESVATGSALAPLDPEQQIRVVYSEGSRLEWLPYEKTAARADAYLLQVNPFRRMQYRSRPSELLMWMTTTRNRIAHPSEEALKRYRTIVSKWDASYEEPGNWLMDRSVTGSASNLRALVANCRNVAHAVSEPRDVLNLDSLLGAPARVSSNQNAIPGEYRCAGPMVHRRTITRPSKLEKCADCGAENWYFEPK